MLGCGDVLTLCVSNLMPLNHAVQVGKNKVSEALKGQRCGQRARRVVRPCHPVCGKILGGK